MNSHILIVKKASVKSMLATNLLTIFSLIEKLHFHKFLTETKVSIYTSCNSDIK